jgi:hypothetical protein
LERARAVRADRYATLKQAPNSKHQNPGKHQAPNAKQASNSKHQIANNSQAPHNDRLRFGAWELEFVWNLFGIWDLRFGILI